MRFRSSGSSAVPSVILAVVVALEAAGEAPVLEALGQGRPRPALVSGAGRWGLRVPRCTGAPELPLAASEERAPIALELRESSWQLGGPPEGDQHHKTTAPPAAEAGDAQETGGTTAIDRFWNSWTVFLCASWLVMFLCWWLGYVDFGSRPDALVIDSNPLHPQWEVPSQAEVRRFQKTLGAFFAACTSRGIEEVAKGRLTRAEVEEVDPRLLLALPGLVILDCCLVSSLDDSEEVECVWLPDGTEVTEAAIRDSANYKGIGSFYARLLIAKQEIKSLRPLNDGEQLYLETRALQGEPEPVSGAREATLNRAAAAVAAAAMEATQLNLYSSMDEVLSQLRASTGVSSC